ncbi:MAG TPA: IPT/TIG domain-containing protein [Solirubrobacterales bacterium]|nr:IPT/TIG domain-containing protein [Solirubrobacterales bacterium]
MASGASYTIPAPGGVLTSWSTSAAAGAGQLYEMKVFRPGAGSYTVVAHDGPHPLIPGIVNTFPVDIPVQAGDIVGIHLPTGSSPTACGFETGSIADVYGWREGDFPDGAIFTPEETEPEWRLNVAATLLPPPSLTALNGAKGSVKGGTSVTLTGTNLAEVKGVSFGSTAATFTVTSETQITAKVPAAKKLGKVPVTVTTVAGTASSPTSFEYQGCKVPNLSGKKLKPAKKALKKAGCKLGTVKLTGDATNKTGKVIKQNPKSGKILAPSAKVGVKLG